jgi:SAM-dependent methyltransferase
MATQKDVVQGTLFGFAASGATDVESGDVVDAVLQHHAGLFTGQTPRNSVRRTLTDLQAEGLVIKDGRGRLCIKMAGLVDTVVQGDVLHLLRLLPDNSIPLLAADPPWSYLMEAHASKGTTTRMVGHSMRWFDCGDLPETVIQEIYRVLKPGGTFLCWFPPAQDAAEDQWGVLPQIRKTGFRLLREVTWAKGKGGGYGWAPSSEPCFIFYKGPRPKFYDLSVTNLLEHSRLREGDKTRYTDFTFADGKAWEAALKQYGTYKQIPPEVRATLKEKHHGAEKSVPMLVELLRPVLGRPGHEQPPETDRFLLDLYSGTGSASVAAKRLGARYCAVEADPRNVEHLILPRLASERVLVLEAAA